MNMKEIIGKMRDCEQKIRAALRNSKFFQSRLFEIVILVAISALIYLPNIGKLTYYKDDWYYIHDASIAGPGVFQAMFAIDRPARGPFFELYYSLFSYQALPYHVAMFLWRIIAVIGALWLFNILWPKNRKVVFGAALLFAIYPGFLWWMRAIEDQPMIASLALEVFSIVFTLKAIQASRPFFRAVYGVGAILTGWAYIALVDYAIGIEIFRFLCLFLLVRHGQNPIISSIWKTFRQTVRNWFIYLTVPVGFLVWREFFFTNARRATDVGLQLGTFVSNPDSTTVSWVISLIRSILNVGLFAWITPFVTNFFNIRLRDMAVALFVMFIAVLLIIMKEYLADNNSEISLEPNKYLSSELIWIGLLGTAFGVLPVVMANRYVEFQAYSHYALPASLAGVVLVIGLVNSLAFARLRSILMVILVAVASLTHYSVSINALTEEQDIQRFWWQMAWRSPSIKPGTTLIINYPSGNYGDPESQGADAADLLYYPESNPAVPVHYTLSAVIANDDNAKTVLIGHLTRDAGYRSHIETLDFGNVLVLSQPSNDSCVHVLDSKRPVISDSDPSNVELVASDSDIGNIMVNSSPRFPREAIYGPEPAHQWCYYYEKVDLAIQQNDWGQAITFGNKAVELGLHPEDRSEWLPLILAYAMNDDINDIKTTAPKINQDPFLRLEACQLLKNSENQSDFAPDVQMLMTQTFCRAGK
jgi:hypothetical protein